MRVYPSEQKQSLATTRRVPWRYIMSGLYHWGTWLFICNMVLSQFLCIVWDSTTSTETIQYGEDPRKGITQIMGTNDMPYTDRSVACVLRGAGYTPLLVSQALLSSETTRIGPASDFKVGYRVVDRHTDDIQFDKSTKSAYHGVCQLVERTLDNMMDACTALGYSGLTRDFLRVTLQDDVFAIRNALPILIMPYFDNALDARHAIPTTDGDACVFRLEGAFVKPTSSEAIMLGVNRTVRHERVAKWLGRPGGVWRYGWYEDAEGGKWGGELMSTNLASKYKITRRLFDLITGEEVECVGTSRCAARVSLATTWGQKIEIVDKYTDIETVYIANASQCGLFLFQSNRNRVVIAKYGWETLLSNTAVALLLVRWMLAMLALHHGQYRRETKTWTGGIGCLAGTRTFKTLMFAVLPRLRWIMCVFWTIGCNFEGQQIGLSEAWFTMYPGIVEFMLTYYSLLNIAAKITRRRISDALFAPTVVVLCMTHYFRVEIASSGWLDGVDTRISTVVFSDEADRLQISDFFTSDIAMRLNGNIRELVYWKLALLGVNMLPLLLASSLPSNKPRNDTNGCINSIEAAIAIRKRNIGGLGMAHSDKRLCTSSLWRTAPVRENVGIRGDEDFGSARAGLTASHNTPSPTIAMLPSFEMRDQVISRDSSFEGCELVRLGYIVYGGKYLLEFDDWDIISSLALLRSFFHLWNHRVVVWTLEDQEAKQPPVKGEHRTRTLKSLEPEILRLDDPKLLQVHWWDIDAPDIE